jgi:hypothetical protein
LASGLEKETRFKMNKKIIIPLFISILLALLPLVSGFSLFGFELWEDENSKQEDVILCQGAFTDEYLGVRGYNHRTFEEDYYNNITQNWDTREVYITEPIFEVKTGDCPNNLVWDETLEVIEVI